MAPSSTEPEIRRPGVQRLLERVRPHERRRLTPRERRTELVAAAACLCAGTVMLAAAPSTRPFPALLALALAGAYAVASRTRLFLGAGSAVLSQLVLVPMLLLLPVPTVPLVVAATQATEAGVEVLRGRAHPERIVTAVADAWYALGAAVVLVLSGAPGAASVSWAVMALALLAQGNVDLVTATAREWVGRGIPPSLQGRVLLTTFAIDACLTPLAVLVSAAPAGPRVSLLALVPLLALLAAFASDRRARIAEAVARLDALEGERRRRDAAIRRIGEVCASRLEQGRLLELALETAVDAVEAVGGRVAAGDTAVARLGDCPEPGMSEAMRRAEAAARRSEGLQVVEVAGASAIAHGLRAIPGAGAGGALVAARRHGRFTEDQRALFDQLAGQIEVAMENVALHERIAREATVDELTGLANHRRFQDVLRAELDRSRRSEARVGLVMIDIDGFKAVNDRDGHLQGDAVLRAVAGAVSAGCRRGDVAARYGGEELAVVAPGTDAHGAWVLGEAIRGAIQRTAIPRSDGSLLRVTASVGTAASGPGRDDAESLVAAADAALYVAKRTGKNRTVRDRQGPETEAGTPSEAAHRRFARDRGTGAAPRR